VVAAVGIPDASVVDVIKWSRVAALTLGFVFGVAFAMWMGEMGEVTCISPLFSECRPWP
jgi:hypothetical protein